MTIYAYIHEYTDGQGNQKTTVASTFDPKFLPPGVVAQEFPDGTPLTVVNGQIEPEYLSSLSSTATKGLAQLSSQYFQQISAGFSYGENTVTLGRNDQLNNQLNLSVASFASLTAVPWKPGLEVLPTMVVTSSGTYWEPTVPGTTGTSEPAWISGAEVQDGSVTWHEILFPVGTTAGNILVDVPTALSIGASGAKFINIQRLQYQATKAQVQAFLATPTWTPGVSASVGNQIIIPQTGGVWTVKGTGVTGAVQPFFSNTTTVVADGSVTWMYVGQALDILNNILGATP